MAKNQKSYTPEFKQQIVDLNHRGNHYTQGIQDFAERKQPPEDCERNLKRNLLPTRVAFALFAKEQEPRL